MIIALSVTPLDAVGDVGQPVRLANQLVPMKSGINCAEYMVGFGGALCAQPFDRLTCAVKD